MKLSSDIIAELSKQYGDAFYLLHSKRFEQNFIELKKAFTDIYPKFNIAYSYKTNYISAPDNIGVSIWAAIEKV
jgi:diaminopimelate decarboxylase